MSDQDQLSTTLQESVLTLLAFNQDKGHMVSGLLTPDLFEEPYRDIATRLIAFHAKFGSAPGREHIDDVFDHVLTDPDHKQFKTYERILRGLMAQAQGLNADYVVSRVTEFIRRQSIKQSVLKAAQRFQTGGDNVADDAERILLDGMKVRMDAMSPGIFMDDDKAAMAWRDDPIHAVCDSGIHELDIRDIGPTRKELMFLQAPKGSGKTWFAINYGKRAVIQGKRVAHVTLEMSEKRCSQRYHQSMFDVAKRDVDYNLTVLEKDRFGNLTGMSQESLRPTMSLDDPGVDRYMLKERQKMGLKLGNLLIKEFPSGSLTVPKLRSWLDYLAVVHNWVPDILIIDYADLMYVDPKDHRHSLGRIIVDLRGVAHDYNLACITMKQTNREGIEAKKVTSRHASEDISAFFTADIAITYSRTVEEKALGLARLYVEKARNDEDGFTILITQNYKTGQFVLESVVMHSSYFDKLKAFAAQAEGMEEDEEEDE